jgi:hypothetical protein
MREGKKRETERASCTSSSLTRNEVPSTVPAGMCFTSAGLSPAFFLFFFFFFFPPSPSASYSRINQF